MDEHQWFCIRTVPGSQKPQREFTVETTRSRKGYRIVPSLNPNISAIELALSQRGLTYWMPTEKRLVRDRRKTDLWRTRRFALLVGYIFVRGPLDWLKLSETPGVLGIVANAEGEPLPIDFMDLLMLRSAEAEAEVVFDQAAKNARHRLRKKAKSDEKLQKLVAFLDLAGLYSVPVDSEVLAA